MIRYLLQHRIAVFMAFLALVTVGCVTYFTLPVSLLPDIDIPHIAVQVTRADVSARELENTVVAPLRRQLMQTNGLNELKSETRDGSAMISLTMNYGIDTDLAFIEVNEKIDGAMNSLPKDLTRPKAVKANATDIPVVFLQMTAKDNGCNFMELSRIADEIVRRRLEQQPEIAMVDITGVPGQVLRITPDVARMGEIGLTAEDLETALSANNTEPGSMTVRDGYYEYNIHVSNLLRNGEDVRNIPIRKGSRILALGDVAEVNLTSKKPAGYSVFNGNRAVTLAIIKQADESMANTKKALRSTIDYFSQQYPGIEFTETRSQTELLDFTISNFEQNLILGLILVFIICIAFMRNVRLSVVIGLSIVTGVILTFLLFYLFHVSVNIISMSGLILAIGMMIDNSVIVTENITQYRQRGESLEEACVLGTNEMITPMLSASLTTVAVFVPLVFMSGIAGAIFSDQAFSITAGLAASYIVAITLLPVLYYQIESIRFRKDKSTAHSEYSQINRAATPKFKSIHHGEFSITNYYDRGMDFCFRHKWLFIAATLFTVPLCVVLFVRMPQQRMPDIDSHETLFRIDWNENISLEENRRRTLGMTDSSSIMTSAYIGPQDFMLNSDIDLSTAETELYMMTENTSDIPALQERVTDRIKHKYPHATVSFYKPDNVFEKIFTSKEAAIEARIHGQSHTDVSGPDRLAALNDELALATGQSLSPIPMRNQIDISIDRALLAVYNIDWQEVQNALRAAFKGNEVSTLRSFQQDTPIEIEGSENGIWEVISGLFVRSRPDKEGRRTEVPMRNLIRTSESNDLKTIVAGEAGEYVPVGFKADGNERRLIEQISETVRKCNG